MNAKMLKTGRPKDGDEQPTLRTIHVALDAAADKALKALEEKVSSGVRRGRRSGRCSIAVREALLMAAARL